MTVTIGINGFGRIGRCTLAHIAEAARNDVQVVKINATGPIETNAHLLKLRLCPWTFRRSGEGRGQYARPRPRTHRGHVDLQPR